MLDACLIGTGEGHEASLAQAAMLWMVGVAGPIRSFLDGKPICMTCQAGVQGGDASQGYSSGDYGLTGLRAYVGPSFSRGLDDGRILSALDDTKPWFRFAAESAAPQESPPGESKRRFTRQERVASRTGDRRSRRLAPRSRLARRHRRSPVRLLDALAVFEFPRNSAEIAGRAELERTIRYFAEHFRTYDTIDRLMDEMVREGFDADLVHEVESVSTIAFGRLLFESRGLQYPQP